MYLFGGGGSEGCLFNDLYVLDTGILHKFSNMFWKTSSNLHKGREKETPWKKIDELVE